MKTWNVRYTLNSSPSSILTTVNAKTYEDAKRIIQGQYGSNLRTINSITEAK